MGKATIKDAVIAVLKTEGIPLLAREITQVIIAKGYFKFNSKDPAGTVSTEIRRHCENSPQSGTREILFVKVDNGGYWLSGIPVPKQNVSK
jgi:hypothetical protein